MLNMVDELVPFCRSVPDTSAGKGRGLARTADFLRVLESDNCAEKGFGLGGDANKTIECAAVNAHPVSIEHVKQRLPACLGTCNC